LPAAPLQALSRLPRDENPCFSIHSVALIGDTEHAFSGLLNALDGTAAPDSPIGRCVGAEGVQVLLARLQNALVARGYVTSRLTVESQDLRTGRLSFTLLPGRVNAIRWRAGANTRASLGNALPVQRGDLLNLRDLEQGVDNFKHPPSVEVDLQIEPAAEAGVSDVVLGRTQAFPLRLNVTADDAGTSSTGKYQGSTTLSVDNALGLSDLFYLTLNHDLGGGDAGARGTRGYTLHGSVPLGYWALGASKSRNHYHQTIVGLNQNYLYSGTSEQSDIKLSRVLHRNGVGKTTAHLKVFQRSSNNFIDDTEVRVQRRVVGGWELGLAYRGNLGIATLDGNLAYKRGTGAFGAIPAPEQAFGEGTARMGLFSAEVNLSVPFTWANQHWTYSGNGRAQWNRTPLTPQDRFTIGGRYSVRGFDGQGSLSAERGWLLRNEILTPIGTSNTALYLGLDHAELGGTSTQWLADTRLTGLVLGLRGVFGKLQFDVFAGTPARKPARFITDATTAGLNLSLNF
jgi:hemolysin activation/secretion protein